MDKLKILLIIILAVFYFGASISIIFCQYDISMWIFILCFLFLFYSILLSIGYVKLSIKNKKFDIFSCYFIAVIFINVLLFFTIIYIKNKWNNEMYNIVGKIENYYLINGIKEIKREELLGLGIKEKIYITINDDESYYIVNKSKNIVYRSDWNKIVEEDNDY